MNSSIRRIPRRSGSKIDASLRASAHTGVAIPWIFLECSGALVGATIGRPFSFLNPFFFSPAEKEKNGFNLPRKEREQRAYRCPEFDSENLSHQLSVASIPTTRKVSARCSRLSEMPSMRFQLCTRPPPQRIAYPSGEGVCEADG